MRTDRARAGRLPLGTVGALAAAAVLFALAGASWLSGQRGPAHTAYASAPPGTYALVVRAGETRDEVYAVPLANPAGAFPVAAVDHLPGFASVGAASPDGRRLALVVANLEGQGDPRGSLVLVDLATGEARVIAAGLDRLQPPAWAPSGEWVVATATEEGAERPVPKVIRVALGGAWAEVAAFPGALGAFPFAVDPAGRTWSAVIDGEGSWLYRDGVREAWLSRHITRDWELSPDGSQVAFIEVSTDAGLEYLPRVVPVAAGGVAIQSLLPANAGQALGVAWGPGAGAPAFGREPGSSAGGRVDGLGFAVSALSQGFDVPLAFSPDGSALAVQHWSGADFTRPGGVSFEALLSNGERIPLGPAARFLGWVQR